ncbi:MAG: hypothetical protein KZQ99_05725 [Candidatus Thiodiazotropha sp. (ex Dulcina madagascariensis)]|nr:hypothetical protein [Candidatus Thiodiazotropha sp. (ex Dulcina madagascariensis)]
MAANERQSPQMVSPALLGVGLAISALSLPLRNRPVKYPELGQALEEIVTASNKIHPPSSV